MNLIGKLGITDSVVDFNTSPELNGAVAVATVEINGTTYVYVAGRDDAGIQILTLDATGKLTPIGVFEDTGSIYMANPSTLDIATVGNATFLIASSRNDDGVTVLKISGAGPTRGQLSLAESISAAVGGGGHLLDYADDVEVFTTSKGTFVAVTAYYSDAVSIFKLGQDGTLSAVDSAVDTADASYRLGGALGVSVLEIGNKTFLYAGAQGDNGVMAFELDDNGKMTFVSVLDLGNVDLNSVTAAKFNGKNYLILTDSSNGEFEVYTIGDDGVPVFASTFDAYVESGNRIYQNYTAKVVQIDGVDFLISQGFADDSVTVYTIGPDDRMVIVETIRDTQLDGASDVTHVSVGGRHFLLAAATNGDRITAIEVGGGDDVVVGTNDNDQIVGLIGDDDLIGRAGNDIIKGGVGDDVLSGRIGNDKLYGDEGVDILIGGLGADTLDGGAGGDFLLGGGGNDRVSYLASDAAVSVDLTTGKATGGHADGDFLDSIENLTGSKFDDTLKGSAVRDVIGGGNGNDTILGEGGNDKLNGHAGNDTISGGDGNDTIQGSAGNDRADGGEGADKLLGAAGRDRLNGDAGNDTLDGGSGNDILNGGQGRDKMKGGTGSDTFVFVALDGADTVSDFEIDVDKIDFSGHADYNSFADVVADAFLFQGTTVIGSGQHSIQLSGVRLNQLDGDDFIF